MTEGLLFVAGFGVMVEINIAQGYQLTGDPRLALIGLLVGAATLGGAAAALKEIWR